MSSYYYVSSGLIHSYVCAHTTVVGAGEVGAYQPLVLLFMLPRISIYMCSHTVLKKKQEPEKWEPINHSCDPNTWLEGLNTFARYSVYLLYWYKSTNTDSEGPARRRIARGEELTIDYATFCVNWCVLVRMLASACVSIPQHTSAYV